MPGLNWRWYRWHDLTADTLYEWLKLRSDIFVVEQNCVFSDMDGLDPQCEHLCGLDSAGHVRAGLRLVPPGVRKSQVSLGRLVVHRELRKAGAGAQAMREGLRVCAQRYPGQPVLISAQQHLEHFYGSLGFSRCSDPYLEDGIWHIEMTSCT